LQYSCGYINRVDEWKGIFSALDVWSGDDIRIQKYSLRDKHDFIFAPVPPDYNKIKELFQDIKTLRKVDRETPIVFFALHPHSLPDPFHPEGIKHHATKELIGRQKFEDVSQAVFYGELIFKREDATEGGGTKRLLNVVDVSSLKSQEDIVKSLSEIKQEMDRDRENIIPELRKRYYATFVEFYDSLTGKVEKSNFIVKNSELLAPLLKNSSDMELFNHTLSCLLTKDDGNLKKLFEWADKTYAILNGADDSSHKTDMELFCAPIPFLLYELIDTKNSISDTLKDKKIKLLLIDNVIDDKKNRKRNKYCVPEHDSISNGVIPELFKKYRLEDYFELYMLGDIVFTKNDDKTDATFYKRVEKYRLETINNNNCDFNKERFNFKKFKEEMDRCLKLKHKKIREFRELNRVYERIKSSHFILLDFFLNEENTYLAFDFIKDISEIKKREGDYSTTWYFITSAVYDSVVKYSQSGLLAEYYESAVVNAGDDPTNEKRQIIFVYKLLTFIQARLKTFDNYKRSIFNTLLGDKLDENNKKSYCVHAMDKDEEKAMSKCSGECQRDRCLEKLQREIKKLLTEYDNVGSIFFDDREQEVYETIFKLLDTLIKQFLWLPEADWQIIQHQIDFIDEKLDELGDKRKFSCNYIIEEIRKRSELY